MILTPGKIYVHVDGGRYRVTELGLKMKCPSTGEWFKAVMYEAETEDFHTGQSFVRTQKDFCDRFKLVAEEKHDPR